RVVLEHHRDVTILRRDVGDVAIADQDATGIDLLEAGEHAQGGRLAAAGRADEDEELAVADLDVEAVDGRALLARIHAGCVVERDCCHGGSPSPAGTCRTVRCEVMCGRLEIVPTGCSFAPARRSVAQLSFRRGTRAARVSPGGTAGPGERPDRRRSGCGILVRWTSRS